MTHNIHTIIKNKKKYSLNCEYGGNGNTNIGNDAIKHPITVHFNISRIK